MARLGMYVYPTIIISLLMFPLRGTGLPYRLHIRRTDQNLPRGPSVDWWATIYPREACIAGLRRDIYDVNRYAPASQFTVRPNKICRFVPNRHLLKLVDLL
jgi:hypothetical protein